MTKDPNKTHWEFNDPDAAKRDRGIPDLGGEPTKHSQRSERSFSEGPGSWEPKAPSSRDPEATRIFTPPPKEDSGEHTYAENIDPVTGWLVVIRGPGKGQAVALGGGVNAVGRDPGERVALPFGDALIARKAHASILYDDRSRSFMIRHAQGTNVTRLNDQLVGDLQPLKSGDRIEFGNETMVRFVAFCGEDFDWSDT